MTVRLPIVGSDNGLWGGELNTFLGVSFNADGTLSSSALGTALGGVSTAITLNPASGAPAAGQVPVALSPTTWKWATPAVDWINAVVQYGADPSGLSDSTTAINNALAAAVPGQVVYLSKGTYLTSAPIVIPAGVMLKGPVPVTENGGGTTTDVYGAVIKPTAGWTNGPISAGNNPGVVYVNGQGTTIYRPGLDSLWIDLRSAPTATHGLSVWGGCSYGSFRNFGILGPATTITSSGTGNLVYIAPDGSNNKWVGGVIENAVLRNAVGNAMSFNGQDSQLIAIRAQAFPGSTGSLSGVYLVKASNTRLTRCLSENSGDSGFVVDSNPGGVPNSPGSTVIFNECRTNLNQNYGLKVINSSSLGNAQVRAPVTAVNCSFDSDGAQGGVNPTSGAGVYVQGVNVVNLLGCNVTTSGNQGSGNSHFYPEYGLVTATPGVPQRVYWRGGIVNCNSGPVNDGAAANPIVEVGTVIGSAWVNSSTVASYTLNAGGGGGFADPETAIGDMIFRNGSNVTARLPIGLANQVLTSIGGVPTWATPPTATIILPSTDTTGVADTKAIINAINGMTNGGIIYLGPGTFYVTYVAGWSNAVTVGGYSGITGAAIVLPAQTTTGTQGGGPISIQGSPASVVRVVGNYIGIYYHRTSTYGAQYSNPAQPSAGFIRDIVIDGTNATGTSAVGLDVGDARGFNIDNVTCQNFSGAGQYGCKIINRLSWTEKSWFRMQFYNNTTACYLSTNLGATGDHSNEYNDYNFTLFANQNQNGIVVDGINQGGSNLWLKGNMCQTTATSFSFTATNASPCVFTATGSNYANGTQVTLSGTLPGGFNSTTTYYVVNATANTFQLSLTFGGAAINSTSTGSGTVTPVPTGNVAAVSIINAAGITDPAGHRWYMGSIYMKVEGNQTAQYPTGNVFPYGLYSDGVGYIRDCQGIIAHSLSNSNWNGAEFRFSGKVSGDPGLSGLSPNGSGGTTIGQPAFPGFGVGMQNTGPDAILCLQGGGTTGVTIAGNATGLSSGAFFVKAGTTATVTGSGSNPTKYVWIPAV